MRNGIFLLRIPIDENNNIWNFLSKHCFLELTANTSFCYLKIIIIVLDEWKNSNKFVARDHLIICFAE
jgi:hypothetical protein